VELRGGALMGGVDANARGLADRELVDILGEDPGFEVQGLVMETVLLDLIRNHANDSRRTGSVFPMQYAWT
jgi:hypothetical protein